MSAAKKDLISDQICFSATFGNESLLYMKHVTHLGKFFLPRILHFIIFRLLAGGRGGLSVLMQPVF